MKTAEEVLFESKFKDLTNDEKQKIRNGLIPFGFEQIIEAMEQYAKLKANPVENRVIPKIVKTLREKIEEAFNDMTTIYAPELTGDGKDKLAKKIQKYGKGTLGYISDKRNEAIKTLEELLSNFSA